MALGNKHRKINLGTPLTARNQRPTAKGSNVYSQETQPMQRPRRGRMLFCNAGKKK